MHILHRCYNISNLRKPSKWPTIELPPLTDQSWKAFKFSNVKVVMILANRMHSGTAFRKYDKQMAAQSIAAIAYAQVYAIDQWNQTDIDKIMETGKVLHRTSILRSKTDEYLHPIDIETNFYIDFTKITTLVGASRLHGILKHDDHDYLLHGIFNILKHNAGCILGFGQKYYAMRIETSGFYLFYPCDNDRGNKQFGGLASCIRLPTTIEFAKCLLSILQPHTKTYELISVQIMQLTEVSKYPEENPVTELSMRKSFDSDKSVMGEEHPAPPTLVDTVTISDEDDTKHTSFPQKIPGSFDVAPYLDDFSQAYIKISDGREILRAYNYVEQVYI